MKKFFPVYPILLGLIWVIATYVGNKSILPSASVMVTPLLVVTGCIAAVGLITQLFVKDWGKSAMVASSFFLFTVFHGYIRDYTHTDGMAAAPIWLVLMLASIFIVLKITRPTGRLHLTVVSNVLCISILLVCTYSAFFTKSEVATKEYDYTPEVVNSIHNPTPDVYYIIPDTYASFSVLENYLDYDNSEFYDYLVDKGFDVVYDSKTNYHHTILSVSSVLNMRYWTDEELGSEAARYLGNRMYQNPVADTFKEAGYTYVHIGSWWGFTSSNNQADITKEYSKLKEFPFALYRGTIWYDLADFLFDMGGNHILREAHLGQFDSLVEVSKMPEKTFTFCHLITPHPPFLFDAEGNNTSGWMLPPDEWREMYLDQLTFITTKLEETIGTILSNSDVTPIIILAADEGYAGTDWQEYWTSRGGLKTVVEDRPDLVFKRQGNLFAILNPYKGELEVPISPVNTFKYVFNSLFDSNLDYLPDKYFLKSLGENEHEFIDVTEFINGED